MLRIRADNDICDRTRANRVSRYFIFLNGKRLLHAVANGCKGYCVVQDLFALTYASVVANYAQRCPFIAAAGRYLIIYAMI